MLDILKTKDSQIIQHNKMLLGGQTINLRARQLVYVLAAAMNNPDEMIEIDAQDFLAFINQGGKEKWTDVYAITDSIFEHLNDNPILFRKPKSKDFRKINWLSQLGVENGKIIAQFSPNIAEYFFYKQGLPYTKLLWDLRGYKSSYTARILDLFQRFHIKESGKLEVTFDYDVEELKLFFGVHDSYPRFFDFEKRVLKVASKELEESDTAPYWFDYEKKKRGKFIAAIQFTVYVRPKILLGLAPEIGSIGGDRDQMSLFRKNNGFELTEEGARILDTLIDLGLSENFAVRVISNLTYSQARGYYYLINYGVNRTLAFTLIKEHCSFGELVGAEDHYIKFALEHLEAARIRRLTESRKGKHKKRTTPDSKKGGLAKKVFEERQYFPAFMEELSTIRREYDIEPPRSLVTYQ